MGIGITTDTNGNPAVTPDTTETRLATLENSPVTKVGAEGAPAFAVGWGNLGGIRETLGFFRVGSLVIITGTIVKNPAPAVAPDNILTLPVGFRPAQGVIDVALASSVLGRVDINTDGSVMWGGGNPASFFSINSVFRAI